MIYRFEPDVIDIGQCRIRCDGVDQSLCVLADDERGVVYRLKDYAPVKSDGNGRFHAVQPRKDAHGHYEVECVTGVVSIEWETQ